MPGGRSPTNAHQTLNIASRPRSAAAIPFFHGGNKASFFAEITANNIRH
jgi:hypothetical protein